MAIPKGCTEPLQLSGAEHETHKPWRKVKNPSGPSVEAAVWALQPLRAHKPAKPKRSFPSTKGDPNISTDSSWETSTNQLQ